MENNINPDAKVEDEKWNFWQTVYDMRDIYGADQRTNEKPDGHQAWWYAVCEVEALATIVCEACSGFGHTQTTCPTRQRITHFGSSGGRVARVLSAIRRLMRMSKNRGKGAYKVFSGLGKRPRKKVK